MNSFHTRKSHMQKLTRKFFLAALIGLSGGALALSAGCSADSSSVPAPPATTFSANPPTVQAGGTTTLTWTSASNATGVQNCSASETDPNGDPVTGSGAFTGPQATSGSFDFTAPTSATSGQAYTFTLTCTDGNGASTARTVSVPITGSTGSGAGPVINFSANPSVVDPGGVTQLAWTTTNAQSCTSSETDPSGSSVT
ncbi:MAG: hypothetical protein L0H29_09490, partial [Sinobacteraceae bacterium]|nr:hypothetical protein [Nevskiaceae bacterium]